MNEIESYVAAVVGTLTGMTISEEDWNKLTDPELERTTRIFFKTPSGKRVEYIRADVLDKIRTEIMDINVVRDEYSQRQNDYCDGVEFAKKICLQIINKYKSESEVQDADSD
jgi:hypothetical protein